MTISEKERTTVPPIDQGKQRENPKEVAVKREYT